MPGKRKRGNDASKLEGQLGSLTPSQIREELRALGESVGPIDASNKYDRLFVCSVVCLFVAMFTNPRYA